MKIQKIISGMNEIFPLFLQEKYDNSGSQVVFPDKEVSSILLSLDIDDITIDEALEKGCNMIITHHPFIFKPLSRIVSTEPKSAKIVKLIENKISLYAAHTNLDKLYYDRLGTILGLINGQLLFETDRLDYNPLNSSGILTRTEEPGPGKIPVGFGMLGDLMQPAPLHELIERVKESLGLQYLVYSGELQQSVEAVAILNGSGGGSIERIINKYRVDAIITGDVGYHHSKFALDHSVAVIDAGHFGTERILIDFLKSEIQDYLTKLTDSNDIKIYVTEKEQDPFKVFI
ncbi:MAG: Nif3-like dinuclear metal center hexameric protein [bacterium]|nr:Nif3-like dinuclear metal center hexameric protein [bacterium]